MYALLSNEWVIFAAIHIGTHCKDLGSAPLSLAACGPSVCLLYQLLHLCWGLLKARVLMAARVVCTSTVLCCRIAAAASCTLYG